MMDLMISRRKLLVKNYITLLTLYITKKSNNVNTKVSGSIMSSANRFGMNLKIVLTTIGESMTVKRTSV